MVIKKPTKPKGTLRKQAIIKAFKRCVSQQGYANTAMADVAKEAGLFPSHIFYYFDSKQDLLRNCCQQQCEVVVMGLSQMIDLPLEKKIDYVTDFLFISNDDINRSTSGFMYEAIGVAVNDPILSDFKLEMDRNCKQILSTLFTDSDANPESREEKGEIIYWLLVGAKLNAYFDPDNGLENAANLFKKALRATCGLPPITETATQPPSVALESQMQAH
jgi:TetR/AcrR family transcriptional repressor of uid operon